MERRVSVEPARAVALAVFLSRPAGPVLGDPNRLFLELAPDRIVENHPGPSLEAQRTEALAGKGVVVDFETDRAARRGIHAEELQESVVHRVVPENRTRAVHRGQGRRVVGLGIMKLDVAIFDVDRIGAAQSHGSFPCCRAVSFHPIEDRIAEGMVFHELIAAMIDDPAHQAIGHDGAVDVQKPAMVDAQIGIRAADADDRGLAGISDARAVKSEAADAKRLAAAAFGTDRAASPRILRASNERSSRIVRPMPAPIRIMPLFLIFRAGTPGAVVLYTLLPAGTTTVSPSCAASMTACTSCWEQVVAVRVTAWAGVSGEVCMPSREETRIRWKCRLCFIS